MLLRVLFVFLGVSVDGFVDQSACLDPRHHAAQALTDHFDLVTLQQATPGSERGIACLVFQDEVLGVFAILNKRAYSFDSSGMERESGTQAASRALGICLSPVIVIVR